MRPEGWFVFMKVDTCRNGGILLVIWENMSSVLQWQIKRKLLRVHLNMMNISQLMQPFTILIWPSVFLEHYNNILFIKFLITWKFLNKFADFSRSEKYILKDIRFLVRQIFWSQDVTWGFGNEENKLVTFVDVEALVISLGFSTSIVVLGKKDTPTFILLASSRVFWMVRRSFSSRSPMSIPFIWILSFCGRSRSARSRASGSCFSAPSTNKGEWNVDVQSSTQNHHHPWDNL